MPRTRIRKLVLVVATLFALGGSLPWTPVALGQMDHTGSVSIKNDHERRLFSTLLCMCGGCARLALSVCPCAHAHRLRDEIRLKMDGGMNDEAIQQDYVNRYGTSALSVPPAKGVNQLLYILPLTAIVLGAGFVIWMVNRLRRREAQAVAGGAPPPAADAPRDAYDDKLDDELKRLDE